MKKNKIIIIIQTFTGFESISFFLDLFSQVVCITAMIYHVFHFFSAIQIPVSDLSYVHLHTRILSAFTCERRSSDRRYGHEEELNTDACGHLVHSNDIGAQNGQENHETTIKHTKNYHVHNKAGVTFRQRAQSVCHADDQHGYLEAVESVHSRVVTEFAEEEPTKSRAYGHHTNQS